MYLASRYRSMDIRLRNNINVVGQGPITLIFAHGFGCNQNMWRYIVPAFEAQYTCLLFDHVGAGNSAAGAYDREKYTDLYGYADDLLEIIDQVAQRPVVLIGHSVSGMIGTLAAIKAPGQFLAHVMFGPSPCYLDDGDYLGGFSRADVDELLNTLDRNFLGWASSMAPTLMGASEQPALAIELTDSFSRTAPDIAKHFARVTFLSDHRKSLPLLKTPTLIVQSSDDPIVPVGVGEYMHRAISRSTLCVVDNVGHYPHLSAPHASIAATKTFFEQNGI